MDKRDIVFPPIVNERVSKQIEDRLRRTIFEKKFTFGDKLPSERELAEMFGCSRQSVRDALRSLERAGLLEIRKGVTGGGYVVQGDAKPVVESLKDKIGRAHV